jgi:hypothetical protein
MNAEFILVGIIFILIIFVSSYGTSNKVVPYIPTSSVLPQYKYSSEGFEEEEEEGEEPFEGYEDGEEVEEEGFEGYEGFEGEEDEEGEGEEPFEGYEGYEEDGDEEDGDEGFVGGQYSMNPVYLNPAMESNLNLDEPRSDILSGSMNRKLDPVLDGISHLPGRPDCIGKSANLSNSMGGICLDKHSIDLIKTRGNNFA